MVSTANTRVTARAERRRISPPVAESEVKRFALPYREAVRALSRTNPAIADLALSFPGLLFALASDYGTAAARARCLARVAEGASLRQAADALGLPLWLRRLPAEAFTVPLASVPGNADFNRRIVNHVPAEPWKAAGWLDRVMLARDMVDDEFALWMAWRSKSMPRLRDTNRLVLLCAWAWYSSRPETFGASLMRQRFDASMGLRKAVDEADIWKRRIELAVTLGDGIKDTWYGPGSARGYDIVPLAKFEDFVAEGERMDNCLDQFAPQVQQRNTRIFSIRQDGTAVADLEIGPHEKDPTMPTIEQLRGPGNRKAANGIWQAVYDWLSDQPARLLPPQRANVGASRAVARKLWEPLLAGLEGRPSLRLVQAYLRSGDVLDPEL